MSRWATVLIAPWPRYRSRCGLVYLKNDLTARAMRLGCHYDDHPSWRTR